MAFYGESYQLDQSSIDTAAIRLHFDDRSVAVAAGASFYVGAYADPVELTAADQAVVSWVVETGPGSAGTFTVTSGLDPASAMTPAIVTEALGTFTAAGEQTIASAPASITVAQLLAADAEPTARIAVTSGSIEVLQVKLRVWPPGGSGGAWRAGPDWERSENQVARWYATINGGTPQVPTYEEAWNEQKAVIATWDGRLDTQYGPAFDGQPMHSFFSVFGNFLNPPFTPSGSAGSTIALLSATPFRASPAPELSGGVDPNEIRQEQRASIRGIDGGDATVSFIGWDPAAKVTATDTYLGSVDLPGPPVLTVDPDDSTFRRGPFHHPASFTLVSGEVPLSSLGGQHLALAVMSSLYFTGPPTGDTITSAGADLSASLPYRTMVANYEWFDPAAAPTPPTPVRAPRFFVTYSEVDDDPRDVSHVVGIGKPADDLSIFRVPTPLGTLRELRHGEKVSDVSVAYPLKVKLYDGSWTTVAAMTLDP